MLDCAAQPLPERRLRAVADGAEAPKGFGRPLPARVEVISRFLIRGHLSPCPPTSITGRRGAPRKKGPLIGSPTTLAPTPTGWRPPPTATGALVPAWGGLWHRVWPGRPIRLVVVRRPKLQATGSTTGSKACGRQKPFEAFCTTDLSLSLEEMLDQYEDRWAIDMTMRDGHALYGLAQDQCRQLRPMIGANTCRVVMAAARTLWCIDQAEKAGSVHLRRFRPGYRQKVAPSQLDIAWACRECLHEAGIFPIPRFLPDLDKNQQGLDKPEPIAA